MIEKYSILKWFASPKIRSQSLQCRHNQSIFAAGFKNAGMIVLEAITSINHKMKLPGKEVERGRTEFVSDKPLEFP